MADFDGDAIAAYARHFETHGGRGGRPAALAARRVYLTMVRALARELGTDDVAAGVKVPQHRARPPETLTDLEYANQLAGYGLRDCHAASKTSFVHQDP